MYYEIITTTDNKEVADKISKKIIESEYSPCVQIINNMHSVYRWNNKIEESFIEIWAKIIHCYYRIFSRIFTR